MSHQKYNPIAAARVVVEAHKARQAAGKKTARKYADRLRGAVNVWKALTGTDTDGWAIKAAYETVEAADIVRADKYTVNVGGARVTASPEQEARLRAMDAEARARFARIIGEGGP
jgi:hypothetical protein